MAAQQAGRAGWVESLLPLEFASEVQGLVQIPWGARG